MVLSTSCCRTVSQRVLRDLRTGLLSLLLCFGGLPAAAASDICPRPLRVYLDLHAPSAWQTEEGQLLGMDAELVQAIVSAAGCQLRWELTPMTGARIIKSIETGDIDLMIRASKNAAREQFGWFTSAYRHELVGIYSRRDHDVPDHLTLPQAHRLGLSLIGPASGWYGVEFEQYRNWFKKMQKYSPYPDAVVGTELLFASPSRGQLLLIDADLFYHQLGTRHPQVRPVSGLHISPAYLLLSKKTVTPATVQALDQAIARLQQQGVLQQLEQKYRSPVLQRQVSAQLAAGPVQQDPLE